MNICYYSDKILTPKLNCDVVFKNKEVKSSLASPERFGKMLYIIFRASNYKVSR